MRAMFFDALERTADAHAAVETNAVGKVLIDVE